MQFESAEPALASGSGIGGYAARGVLAPVDQEISATELPITGALPPELDGLYLRNSFNAHPTDSDPRPDPFDAKTPRGRTESSCVARNRGA